MRRQLASRDRFSYQILEPIPSHHSVTRFHPERETGVCPSHFCSASVFPPMRWSRTLYNLSVQPATYFVPRNARHHLPVYTEFRSGGGQCFILIKNIQGHSPVSNPSHTLRVMDPGLIMIRQALANDLSASLFDSADPAAAYMRIEQRSNRLVIKGARPDWKDRIVDWLRARGF